MSGIRVALSVIGITYAVLGLTVVLFAVNLRQGGDIGNAYLAVGVVAWGGTIAAMGLCAGSVLGTLALVRHPDTRRPLYLLAMLSGWLGALVLGWLAWEFWTHSSLPNSYSHHLEVTTYEHNGVRPATPAGSFMH